MKIGIDARPLSHELTGIGRYTLNVLTELFDLKQDVEWYLYSDRPLLVDFELPNVIIRIGRSGPAFTSTLFSQFVFPLWALKDKLDTFWSPRHHLPLTMAAIPNMRKVVTIHDIVWKKHPDTMSKFGLILEKLLFTPSVHIANAVITVSDFTKSELSDELAGIRDKTHTIPLQSFISTKAMETEYPRYTKGQYILFVGTLEPRKNLDNLLKAFQKISRTHNGLKLIVVGKDGWGDVKISDQAKELNIEDKVIVTGFISDEELLSLYQHCDILAMPSLYEGFGLPALEALSLKKKVVVSKFNAIAEFSGDNLFICDLHHEAIARSIEEALNASPKQLANVGNDWSNIAARTFTILESEDSRVSLK
ncbi:Glycosyl transferase, group 1 [Vibrio mediterranei AK1]|uniref:glycosyltransferase family 4 protein n=1 Tax=Vibrio mediterranei TaxID=689 RepID=UPI0001541CD9|nr:glycosyltransferase family 1 protein [Vibrio mediterranei]EDL53897.1 Glycosyl transferase, group 1 [Vibrio mediterranei AK1]